MFAVKSDANKVILNYPDGSQETITLEKAKKANLAILDPPKVEKDTNAQFTPPKVIKDKNVQFTPPKFVKLGSAGSLGGRISLKDIENAKKLEPGSNDYTIENFTVYFTGAGFPHVKSFTQKGAIFSTELQKEWENIKPGTSISFDQVMIDYKGDQIKINNPPGYIVY